MAPVATARWDITWQRGGAWQRRLVRKDTQGGVLGIGGPCVLELRGVDDLSTVAPAMTVTADIPAGNAHALLTAGRAAIEALPLPRYQHRILITDIGSGLPLVLARGWVSIEDRVGG